jgi:hypothetical protein
MHRVMSADELRFDLLELVRRKAREELPSQVERLGDRTPCGALADKAPLELLDEGEDAAVVVGPSRPRDRSQ